MNISNLNKAEVLAALYNNAKVQGLGFLQAVNGDMSVSEAQSILDACGSDKYFDYLKGRVMKIEIKDNLDTYLYNRDNGENAAENVIAKLLK